jgi:hypothetical protein
MPVSCNLLHSLAPCLRGLVPNMCMYAREHTHTRRYTRTHARTRASARLCKRALPATLAAAQASPSANRDAAVHFLRGFSQSTPCDARRPGGASATPPAAQQPRAATTPAAASAVAGGPEEDGENAPAASVGKASAATAAAAASAAMAPRTRPALGPLSDATNRTSMAPSPGSALGKPAARGGLGACGEMWAGLGSAGKGAPAPESAANKRPAFTVMDLLGENSRGEMLDAELDAVCL